MSDSKKEAFKRYYEANKERLKANHKKYFLEHKEEIYKNYREKYYRKNYEKSKSSYQEPIKSPVSSSFEFHRTHGVVTVTWD